MILITRPKNDAEELQKQLKKKNIKSLIDPLTHFQFINRKIIFREKSIYICASQKCAEAMLLINKDKNINLIVVGKKVEEFLKQENFKNILYVAVDTKKLIQWICKKNNYLKSYIYLSGNIINNDFVYDLKKFQISYKRKIIYNVLEKTSLNRITLNAFKINKTTSVVFYSTTAVKIFIKLVKRNRLDIFKLDLTFFVLSLRIANYLKKIGIRSNIIKISNSPNQKSMIMLLNEYKTLINNEKI